MGNELRPGSQDYFRTKNWNTELDDVKFRVNYEG